MSEKILVIGESGSGKSTATRNLNPKETFYINVIGKPLPFKGWKSKFVTYNKETKKGNLITANEAPTISAILIAVSEKMPEIKTIIIDDAQYIMSYEFMKRAKERGFDKFVEIAQNMFNVFIASDRLRDDITVVFLTHSEDVNGNGYTKTKMKTIGKMLDDKITVEGLFTIVLQSICRKTQLGMEYLFMTQNDGTTTAKSPMDMFKTEEPNDLVVILDKVKKYDK